MLRSRPRTCQMLAVERLDMRLEYMRHAIRQRDAPVPLREVLHAIESRMAYRLSLDVPLPFFLCDVNLAHRKLD